MQNKKKKKGPKKKLLDLNSFETFFEKDKSNEMTEQEKKELKRIEESKMAALDRQRESKFTRTVMPIEQDCKLGGAIIGRKTVQS